MEKWLSVKTPPDVVANRLRSEAAKKNTPGPLPVDSEPTIQPSSAGSTTSSQLFPTLPFQMPAIHFHTGTGSLVNGTGGYMASPSKTAPAIKKPATSEITSDILYAIPAKRFPAIREFLATVDQEEADGEDSPNYSQYADRLIEKGFRRIHLLFDETPKSLRTELELPITIGDAKQLLLLVKRACQKVAQE